jgi:hypothetical protein
MIVGGSLSPHLLARLARGTGVVEFDLEVQMTAYDESAKAFWSVWRDRKKFG